MIKISQYLTQSFVIFLFLLITACDSSKDASKKSQDQEPSQPSSTSSTSAQKLSEDALSCLDLVKSGSYAEAIDPCQRAIQETSSAEVTQAYEKAKAEVMKAAESAAMDAAEDSASDTLRGITGK